MAKEQLLDNVARDTELPPRQRSHLFKLAWYLTRWANRKIFEKTGALHSWRSLQTMATDLAMGKATILAGIKTLAKHKYLGAKLGGKGRGDHSEYTLYPKRVLHTEPFSEDEEERVLHTEPFSEDEEERVLHTEPFDDGGGKKGSVNNTEGSDLAGKGSDPAKKGSEEGGKRVLKEPEKGSVCRTGLSERPAEVPVEGLVEGNADDQSRMVSSFSDAETYRCKFCIGDDDQPCHHALTCWERDKSPSSPIPEESPTTTKASFESTPSRSTVIATGGTAAAPDVAPDVSWWPTYIENFQGTSGELLDWWRSKVRLRVRLPTEVQTEMFKIYTAKFNDLNDLPDD